VPPSEHDLFDETTRDLRRALFISETLELLAIELEAALVHEHRNQQMRAVLHRHLTGAWNDGALKEADLRSSVIILKAQIETLKKNLHDALKRISDGR
jgi:hypothetical protein